MPIPHPYLERIRLPVGCIRSQIFYSPLGEPGCSVNSEASLTHPCKSQRCSNLRDAVKETVQQNAWLPQLDKLEYTPIIKSPNANINSYPQCGRREYTEKIKFANTHRESYPLYCRIEYTLIIKLSRHKV